MAEAGACSPRATPGAPRLELRELASRSATIGTALQFLARRAPFRGFSAGTLVPTVAGQVTRGHYLLALEGRRVAGYLGWAMYDREDALAFARTGTAPPEDRCQGRDVVWLLTLAATERAAMDLMLAEGRRRYAGLRVMGVRHKPGGRAVVFDQPIRNRRSA